MNYSEDELLPISALADIVFCERRAALHRLEEIWQESVSTIEGHLLHDKVHTGEGESRGEVRIARGLRLRSLRLGLSGVADVFEFHRLEEGMEGIVLPGVSGRWIPFPVEYKRGVVRHEESFECQLCAQALCLEEMLNCHIPAGALFYGLSRRRKDILLTNELRHVTEEAAVRLHQVVNAGVTPPAHYEKKCKKCSLLAQCMPQLAGKHDSVRDYLGRTLKSLIREEYATSSRPNAVTCR
ncbi:MAG: CRISPR-associated protein Cas4 [Verrucomicrobia bacterium]|nr:CRISPR-associated protein Cas4 [Verrucomicrobiota bacterium]MBU4429281.1 CRISPR-associated protein Cas4 [Verrucomicrobiota bacterium]MBU4497582.1 CRISPR-associated protein Cas4 [Verrucomicrobiota bacterium]MCG2680740.1 CRISPR-associated protein Cas4 [Kiritimatiellia bacterium]